MNEKPKTNELQLDYPSFSILALIFLLIGYSMHGLLTDMQEKQMTELDVKCNISPFHSLTNTTGYMLVKCKAPFYQGGSVMNITIEGSG